MRRPLIVLLTAALVTALTAGTAAADVAPSGSLTFGGDKGEYITQGRSESLVAGPDVDLRFGSGLNRVDVTYYDGSPAGSGWQLLLGAPGGRRLAPGRYADAVRFSQSGGATPFLELIHVGPPDDRSCTTSTGSFDVATVVYDAADRVQTFDATFEQFCDGSALAARGRVQFGTAPTVALITTTTLTTSRPPPVGAFDSVTVTVGVSPPAARGTVRLRFGDAEVLAPRFLDGTRPLSVELRLPPGAGPLVAEFTGADATVLGSTATLPFRVDDARAPAITLLTGPLVGGLPVEFVVVTKPEVHGTVAVYDGGQPVAADPTPTYLDNGIARIPAGPLAPGQRSFTVRFTSFDGTFSDTESAPAIRTVASEGAAPVGTAPVTAADPYRVLPDSAALTVAAPGVLGNDTDPDGKPLYAVLLSRPAHYREFALYPDGSFAYRPVAGFTGTDTFTYFAADADRYSTPTTVTVTVAPPAPPAIAVVPGGSCAADGTAATVPLALADPDTDAGALTVSAAASDPALLPAAALRLSGTGAARTLTVVPAAARSGRATVTVTVSDGARSATATLPVVVGTSRADILRTGTGATVVLGRDGRDVLTGGPGADLLCGGAGGDTLTGGDGNDVVDGQAGDDVVQGGPGDDVLRGGPGVDLLVGGAGADRYEGGPGPDVQVGFRPAEGDSTDGT